MPELSICLVSLNTIHFLHACLQSLAEHPASLPTEIIVVDNSSTDGTQAMLAQEYPHVLLNQNS